MSIDYAVTIVCVFSIALLGGLIFLRNPQKRTNQHFALLSLSIATWTVFNLLSGGTTTNKLIIDLLFVSGMATALALFIFVANYPNDSIVGKRKIQIFQAITLIVSVLVFHPEFVREVTEEEIITGKLYNLFILYVLGGLILVVYALHKQLKASEGSSRRMQVVFIAWGIILYAILAVASNVIVPALVNDWSSSRFGPVASLFLVGMVGYSIIKHRLFDIRFVVARSLGYIFSVGALGVLYGFLAFNIINDTLFSDVDVTLGQRTAYTLLAVTIAFTFQPLKKFFDKWTNRFFYRDAYDGQALIDELNQTLVSTIDLNTILKRSADILERNIKPEFSVFVLKETEHVKQRIVGSMQRKFGSDDIKFARMALPQMGQKVIVADYLEETHKELQAKMRKNEVAVLVSLTTDVNVEGIGAIALGPKKSGNTYNSQDIKVLEIVANSLVIAIDNALRFEEIQKFNITLGQEIEDATRRLRRANDKLIALDQTKDDFISMASHQLRTPLTSVKGYLSMVLEGDAGKITPKQAKLLDQAFISSQRMVYLIADLLNVSRLRTGKFVIEPKATNLADVIEGEVEQLVETAAARGLKLTYAKPKNFPELMLDETKIRQVIMNFTDNAIHYTKSGGRVQVALKETPQAIEFTVTDNGIGIPRHEQHHLFTKFFRAGNARKVRPDGTGLGLFMAKKVIIAQGGSIIFKSQENKGSTFGFTFSKSRLKTPPTTLPEQADSTSSLQLVRSRSAAAAKTPAETR